MTTATRDPAARERAPEHDGEDLYELARRLETAAYSAPDRPFGERIGAVRCGARRLLLMLDGRALNLAVQTPEQDGAWRTTPRGSVVLRVVELKQLARSVADVLTRIADRDRVIRKAMNEREAREHEEDRSWGGR